MTTKRLLYLSVVLNILMVGIFFVLTYIYRDKIAQRFVSMKGTPAIVMYGNSITAQGKWVELLGRTDVLNSGLPGHTTYHFRKLLQSHVIDLHPRICFLEGGINDITVGVAQKRIQDNFKAILEILGQNNIIPVVTLTLYEQNDPISKAEVDTLNQFLTGYCTTNQILYIDLNKYISDSSGLRSEYAVDKTHINEKAYRIWAKEVGKVLAEKGI